MLKKEQEVMNFTGMLASEDDEIWKWLIEQVSNISLGLPYERKKEFNQKDKIFQSYLKIKYQGERVYTQMQAFGLCVLYSWKLSEGRLIDFKLESSSLVESQGETDKLTTGSRDHVVSMKNVKTTSKPLNSSSPTATKKCPMCGRQTFKDNKCSRCRYEFGNSRLLVL